MCQFPVMSSTALAPQRLDKSATGPVNSVSRPRPLADRLACSSSHSPAGTNGFNIAGISHGGALKVSVLSKRKSDLLGVYKGARRGGLGSLNSRR